jgi:tetratricopeptide (TPR) repeat protein
MLKPKPKVFISYSRDSDEHCKAVLDLADRLNRDDIDCELDQYINGAPDEGFPLWMERQIDAADYVLVICTKTYLNRWEGKEPEGIGQGVKWESLLSAQTLYDNDSRNNKFISVLFTTKDSDFIPRPYKGFSRYDLSQPDGYELLYRQLTEQPLAIKPQPEGALILPPINGVAGNSIRNSKPTPAIFNVPVPRNPVFTGREAILDKLHKTLHEQHEVVITSSAKAAALSGLGGVGKTQTVAEYAHRYKNEYVAVLWVSAESLDVLRTSFGQLAPLIGSQLQKLDEQIFAVKSWLTAHPGWLLIFDNAETYSLLTAAKDLLPTDAHGQVLYTTRAQATGLIPAVELGCFDDETGAVLLLRRSKLTQMTFATVEQVRPSVSAADWQTAITLSHELGGLALAIDQAGAYIEQTGCGLAGYLELFRHHAVTLLNDRGFDSSREHDHPESVYKTFLLALEKAKNRCALVEDMLCMSAFLHPDGIPEELFAGYEPLEINKALAALKDYSFIQRIPDRLFTVHRLVQVVWLEIHVMDEAAQIAWVDKAAIAMNQALPAGVEFKDWPHYERFLLSGLECTQRIIDLTIIHAEAMVLIDKIAKYLMDAKAEYSKAEPLYQRSVAIREKALGKDHPEVAVLLNNLALLYRIQGHYAEAEPLYQRSLVILEKALGKDHPNVANSLNNLAFLYYAQGHYAEAEPLFQRSLAIWEKALGNDHPDVATSLNNLAELYRTQGRYAEAEPLYQRSLAIWEKALGNDHPNVARSLNNLALLYDAQGHYAEAEPLYQRSLAILEKALGNDHPNTKQAKENYELFLEEKAKAV